MVLEILESITHKSHSTSRPNIKKSINLVPLVDEKIGDVF